ncbi:protein DpdD [Polymorphospora sp. NPDC050346]|uniref:protein DpdD n=1 Tax=Polymorphospora sp. NPDC050346 TaxID=3155780 RepID=UPI0033E0AC30
MNHETFLDTFFGPGNASWPGRDPGSNTARFLAEFLAAFAVQGSDVPYILPRNEPGKDRKNVYVIPRDARKATTVREWLNAFVVPSHAVFADRPEPLRAGDPIDDAVATFAGHRRAFVLEYSQATSKELWIALKRMHRVVADQPATQWSETLPVGRLLAEFDLAMASGDHRSSAELLSRLESAGLGGMNIAYLTVKRLARMGRHSELLRLPNLRDIVTTRPPAPVREAVLDALHSTLVAAPLMAGDLDAAREVLRRDASLAPVLGDGPLSDLGVDALTVLALTSAASRNADLWHRLRADEDAWQRLVDAPLGIVESVDPILRSYTVEAEMAKEEEEGREAETRLAPASWTELAEAIAAGDDVRPLLAEETWRSWEPAAAADQALADRLNSLDDAGAERAWEIVGAFVDANGFGEPAGRTARAFLGNAFTYGRFRSSDLAGIVALLEIALRDGLTASDYRQLLADLGAESDRWVSVNNASVVLDVCDSIVRGPEPDPEAREQIVSTLLSPLSNQRTRLEADQLALARIIDGELGLGLLWNVEGQPGVSYTVPDTAREILLYSLDEGALRRAREALEAMAPALTVRCRSDHVGGPQLKQWVRRADIVVMATRCATHAATGFIRAAARQETIITEADGAGSASLLRAASAAL